MKTLKEWVFSTDHKRIGILYLIGSFAAFGLAGIAALIIRLQQYSPGMDVAQGQAYNNVLYFHAAAMILAFLIPGLTGFFGNYFLPIMIGAKDMAFPRLNAFSVWLYLMGVVLALISMAMPDAPDVLWTGYPPYSIRTTANTAFYVFTVHLMGFSSIVGAINIIVTVACMRAPGVGWNQLPMLVWTVLAALVINLIFIPVLGAAVTLLLTDKYMGTHFFDAAVGGDALLYQNLFWFYSHPAVYVIFLPAMGILFEVISTMGQNPVFNYKAAVYGGVCGVAALSGEVWVHHLYTSGLPDWIRIGMTITTLLISVPVGIMIISLWGTLHKAAIRYNIAMYYAVACLFFVLIGGLTGIPLAIVSMTVHLAKTAYVHAHFHYVMALFATFSIFSGVYFWFPKMTNRFADNTAAKVGFWLSFIGANVTFAPLFIVGVAGMPRRYWDYDQFPAWFADYHHVATYGAFIMGLGMLIALVNFVYSAFAGEKCTSPNPWNSNSLEWTQTVSPPGPGNFLHDVSVPAGWSPYQYTAK